MSTFDMHVHHSGPVNPPTAQPASFAAWQARIAPGDVFRYPQDVLAHPHMSRAEKRAVLASWASDACALENAPSLRCLPGTRAEPVPVDAVLAALAQLDREGVAPLPRRRPLRKRRMALSDLRRVLRSGGRDDDDDPPPCPVAALPPPRTPPGAASLALPIPA